MVSHEVLRLMMFYFMAQMTEAVVAKGVIVFFIFILKFFKEIC